MQNGGNESSPVEHVRQNSSYFFFASVFRSKDATWTICRLSVYLGSLYTSREEGDWPEKSGETTFEDASGPESKSLSGRIRRRKKNRLTKIIAKKPTKNLFSHHPNFHKGGKIWNDSQWNFFYPIQKKKKEKKKKIIIWKRSYHSTLYYFNPLTKRCIISTLSFFFLLSLHEDPCTQKTGFRERDSNFGMVFSSSGMPITYFLTPEFITTAT